MASRTFQSSTSILVPPAVSQMGEGVAASNLPHPQVEPLNLVGFFDNVLYPKLLMFCFVGMMFGNAMDLAKEIQGADESNLSFQILYKLFFMMIGLLLSAWGWWFRPRVRFLMTTVPGLMLLTLGGWHLVTAPMALIPTKAFIAFMSYMTVLLVCFCLLVEYGKKVALLASMIGLLLYSIVSVVLYFVSPEMATFKEVMNDVVTVERFGGLAHPNVIGRYAVLTILLAGLALRLGYMRWKWMIPIGAISVGVLLASLSRTPVIAGVAASSLILMPLIRYGKTYVVIALLAMGVVASFLAVESTIGFDVVFDRLIQKTTKTGSTEEITTGTGRTDIWAYSIVKTAERPIFGWGIGSTPIVMEERSGHSHNLLLHPALALGLPGVTLVLMILIYNIRWAFKQRDLFIGTMLLFILVLGLVESPLLGSFPDGVCMLWFIITILPILTILEKTHNLQPVRL